MGILDGWFSLQKGTNTHKGSESEEYEGVLSPATDELELPMENEELLQLTSQWEKSWNESEIKKTWEQLSDEVEKYWKGDQFFQLGEERPLQDNAIFEAVETFLPQATRRNPEPVVTLSTFVDKNEANEATARVFKDRLAELADAIKLRLKMKRVARYWLIYMIGAAKVGWSEITQDITMKVIRPKKLIFDPSGTVDEDGYHGDFLGERRKLKASLLAKMIPEKKSVITKLVDGKMGADIAFIEWHTDEYYCWTVGSEVLLKKQNPHWNYDQDEKTEESVDEYGETVATTVPAVPGKNHFSAPKMPYIFLSVFNLGKQPIDDTGLIPQNLSTQDLINKRLRQIDKNADKMNGGLAVSGDAFTKEQATQAGDAFRKGGVVYVPTGNPSNVVSYSQQPALPSDVFNQLQDTRIRLKDVFGVRGLTTAGIQSDSTVRGKILNKSVDTDRIGGGVTEYLEQFSDDVYNWFVQLMFVYYPNLQGVEIPKLIVSVKEGSLLPKDTASEAQRAIDLAIQGKMSLLDLYKKLEDPNPEEKAANVWLEVNAPHVLYEKDPRVMQVMQMQQAQQQATMAQQQQQEQQKSLEEHGRAMESKTLDHESKMQQMDRKLNGDHILAQVKAQQV